MAVCQWTKTDDWVAFYDWALKNNRRERNNEFFRCHQIFLGSLMKRILNGPISVCLFQEWTQAVWVRAIADAHRVPLARRTRGPFHGWLKKIVISAIPARTGCPLDDDAATAIVGPDSPESVAIDREVVAHIRACLERLSPPERQAVEAKMGFTSDGMPHAQLPEIGRGPKTSNQRTLLFRSLRKVRTCLSKKGVMS